MRAALVVTGTEVLEGRVRDENGAMVAASLAGAGVEVHRITVVGDGLDDIRQAVAAAVADGMDLVVTTGGLGPTHDDRTMEAVAMAAGVPLHLDEDALDMVRAAIATVPARASDEVRERGAQKQAMVPHGAVALPPPGTAPGAVLVTGTAVIVVLPGPPWECAASWHSASLVPEVAAILDSGAGGPVELRLANVVESEFMQAIDRADPEGQGLVVGVCARPGELEVTVRPQGPGADAFVAFLDGEFPGAIFSRDGATVEDVIAARLIALRQALATAESCTGGLIGARLTSRPGASAWYAGGVVSYADSVKEQALGVAPSMITQHGAVSAEVAEAMAAGVQQRLGCDWAIAVTGVAGPDGGTPTKPVGLVFVAIAGPGGIDVRELRLHGDRERIRMRAATIALHLLRVALNA